MNKSTQMTRIIMLSASFVENFPENRKKDNVKIEC